MANTDSSLVGNYDWVKGGSMEKYTQELSLRSDGTAFYREDSETKSESWTRSGSGTWKLDNNDIVWVTVADLKKETKMKNKMGPAIPGFQDEVKVDHNIAIDIPAEKLRTAPPSSATAPKNRWRKK